MLLWNRIYGLFFSRDQNKKFNQLSNLNLVQAYNGKCADKSSYRHVSFAMKLIVFHIYDVFWANSKVFHEFSLITETTYNEGWKKS